MLFFHDAAHINFVELKSPIMYAKFQDHRRRLSKVFTIFRHDRVEPQSVTPKQTVTLVTKCVNG